MTSDLDISHASSTWTYLGHRSKVKITEWNVPLYGYGCTLRHYVFYGCLPSCFSFGGQCSENLHSSHL